MKKNPKSFLYPFLVMGILLVIACNNAKQPPVRDLVKSPEDLAEKAKYNIRELLDYALDNHGAIGDSFFLQNDSIVNDFYKRNYYPVFWSNKEEWKPYSDSLVNMIENAKLYGLFPEDYHLAQLDRIQKRFDADTGGHSDRRDAALWSRADVLLTDAFVQFVKDIKLGRLPKDSITLRKDSVLGDDFYMR